ncbi:MAG TPA: fibronectin type III domain-containing protein, partial [Verrucomicrobiae bacterium]|nr:fibronectin type III domain-containing protein [Verrucomicrobiae bacterium]
MEQKVAWCWTRRGFLTLLVFSCALFGLQSAFASQSVTLQWSPSTDSSVTGYNIYYGVASRNYTNKVTVGNVTNATVTGLQEGVTYYFAATAFNAIGLESDFSEEVSYTVPVSATDNQPPTLTALSNLSINENAATQSVPLSGITSGSSAENQTLTVTATSSNPALIPNPSVSYTSPNATGTLTFTPVSGASGSATITVTVNDGQPSNNIVTRSFVVNVNGKPTISAIPNQSIAINASAGPLPFAVNDPETPAGNLVVTATSSAPALLPVGNIVFGGEDGNRTVTLAPISGQTGSAMVTLTVSDGTQSASTTFQLQVLGIPDAPSILTIITNGDGTVSTSTRVEKMKTGKTYSAVASPAKGQRFAGWTGSVNSGSRKIRFVMESNVVLQANFIPDPFAPISGSYSGLFYESGAMRQESSGFFTIRVTKNGAYSGRLQIGSTRYPFSGKLGLDCSATNVISKRGEVLLTVKFQCGDATDQVQGEVTDGTWISQIR